MRGSNLFEFRNLTHLRFADDVVLVTKNGKELGGIAEDLRRASEEMGLGINLNKTKILSIISALGDIKIMDTKIDRVSEYSYLGQIISFDNKTVKELKVRRANA